MTKLQQKLETFFAGLLYVGIGTVVAVQVNAQGSNRAPASAPSTSSMANCETNAKPGALCAVSAQAPAASKPDFKVCFSSKHPRCFELQNSKLIQSLNGMPAHEAAVTAKQAQQVTKAVKEYREWLESKKTPAPTSVCRNIVTVDLANDRKDLCVSGLAKKEFQEKNKALISRLENPAD